MVENFFQFGYVDTKFLEDQSVTRSKKGKGSLVTHFGNTSSANTLSDNAGLFADLAYSTTNGVWDNTCGTPAHNSGKFGKMVVFIITNNLTGDLELNPTVNGNIGTESFIIKKTDIGYKEFQFTQEFNKGDLLGFFTNGNAGGFVIVCTFYNLIEFDG